MSKYVGNFRLEELSSLPAKENPFEHDASHHGVTVSDNCVILYSSISNARTEYVIIINKQTGERLKVYLDEEP
jgi:hypothetical protein